MGTEYTEKKSHILCPYGRHLIVLFKSQKLTLKDVFGPNHFKFICVTAMHLELDPSLSSSSSLGRLEKSGAPHQNGRSPVVAATRTGP